MDTIDANSPAPTPLRKSLFLRFALLVTSALLLFTLGYVQFGIEPIVDRIAESHFNAAAEKVDASLTRLFTPAEALLGVASQWVDAEHIDPDRPESLNRLFQPLLKQSQEFTSVVAGTSDGRGWMLLELPDGGWINRFTDISKYGHEQRFIDWTADGSRQSRTEVMNYDPRTRPW